MRDPKKPHVIHLNFDEEPVKTEVKTESKKSKTNESNEPTLVKTFIPSKRK